MVALAWGSLAFCGPIHDAAKAGDLAKVKALLKDDPKLVSSKDGSGWTPLDWAVFEAHKDVAELLLAKGANVNARANNGATPLHCAALGGKVGINGQRGVVALLLANKADIDARSDNGMTPLHAVAFVGHSDVVELLLAKGADVNAEDKVGNTPLDYAVQQGRQEVVKLLRAKGADAASRVYRLVQQPEELGIEAELSVSNFTQASDCSGDIEGRVKSFMIGTKPLELETHELLHEGGRAWIVTKVYGKIGVSGGYAGDHPPSGLCFWLTPAQKVKLEALYYLSH